MKKIESPHNEIIKKIVTLRSKKGRDEHKQFIAEGIRTCSTLCQSPLRCIQLYVTDAFIDEAQTLVDRALITQVSEACLKKISTTKTPSGIVGIFGIPNLPVPQKINAGLVLGQISDPGNMGTLIRSSVAFGYSQIIMIEGTDPWGPKVIQSSAGTIGYAQIINITWQDLLNHSDRPTLGALVPHNGTLLNKKDILLVVGNEAHGLPNEWIKQCEQNITLPMPGKVESLNASVAGSIALYTMALK